MIFYFNERLLFRLERLRLTKCPCAIPRKCSCSKCSHGFLSRRILTLNLRRLKGRIVHFKFFAFAIMVSCIKYNDLLLASYATMICVCRDYCNFIAQTAIMGCPAFLFVWNFWFSSFKGKFALLLTMIFCKMAS